MVAQRARRVSMLIDQSEREVLVAAAYLHDIGYAPTLVRSGSHQLDGALHLRALGHERLAGLVANHSSARYELELRGLEEDLRGFPDENSALSRLLTYCDMTTGPTGRLVTLDERLGEVKGRYGADHIVTRALDLARPAIEVMCASAEAALRQDGIPLLCDDG